MTDPSVYLDNAATTRPWPEVREAMMHFMGDGFGNASSLHRRGLDAAREVARASSHIRDLLGHQDWKVIFTSGGSESDTTAVLGSVPRGKRDTLVTTCVEHSAVSDSADQLEERGARVVRVSAGESGVIGIDDVISAVDEKTALVSITHLANELGTVQPIGEIAIRVKRKAPRCRVHVDAVQAAAQLGALDCPREVDMVSLSAHKIHGPQGVGALLLRADTRPRPLICGGDQQDRIRPGTLNLPGIVGFGVAARKMIDRRGQGVADMTGRSARLLEGVLSVCEDVRTLGDPDARAPGMVVLAVAGVRSQVLLHALEARGVTASSGAACHSTRSRPSRALLDAGLGSDEGSLRLSLSVDTSEEDVERATGVIVEAIGAVREGRASRQ